MGSRDDHPCRGPAGGCGRVAERSPPPGAAGAGRGGPGRHRAVRPWRFRAALERARRAGGHPAPGGGAPPHDGGRVGRQRVARPGPGGPRYSIAANSIVWRRRTSCDSATASTRRAAVEELLDEGLDAEQLQPGDAGDEEVDGDERADRVEAARHDRRRAEERRGERRQQEAEPARSGRRSRSCRRRARRRRR